MDNNTTLVTLALIGAVTFLVWTWITNRYADEPEDDDD